MAKQSAKDDIPADMWLRVATDALIRYALGGGTLIVVASPDGSDLIISLPDVNINDPRLAPAFAPMVATAAPQESQP